MSSAWREYKTAEGKPYYHNTATKQTQWTKPAELATGAELWKEYHTPEGKPYWYNTETKQTTWNRPEGFQDQTAQASSTPTPQPVQQQPQQQYQQAYEPVGFRNQNRDREDRFQNQHSQDNFRPGFPPAISNDPEYATYEEAEAALMRHLKKCGVQLNWTYEDAIANCAGDREWRSVHDPRLRKVVFEKYIEDLKNQQKEREEERLGRLRESFSTMLSNHVEIKHYTTYKTARPMIADETVFGSTDSEKERKELFLEHKTKLKKAHFEKQEALRKEGKNSLPTLLTSMNLEPWTRLAQAVDLVQKNEGFQSDERFQALTRFDILELLDAHIKFLEVQFNNQRAYHKKMKFRKERKNREGFVALLEELKKDGHIPPGCSWVDMYPYIKDDPRYEAMLGQPGCTPLEFFREAVDEEESRVRRKMHDVYEILDDKNVEITSKTTIDEFTAIIGSDTRFPSSGLSKVDLGFILKRFQEKASRREEGDRHHAERHNRRAVDDLRSKIKRLQPPVRVGDSWEKDVRPRVEDTREFRAIESEDLRRSAFDKFMRKLKEKDGDADHREHGRRDDRGDREESMGESRRTGRTHEQDPYEADRKRAIADRERQYRKSSGSGLSPSLGDSYAPRRRDARDRYEGRRDSGERGDRRSYLSRADPREPVKALDYGEGGAEETVRGNASGRKRESDSVENGRASSKKPKADDESRGPSKSPGEVQEEERQVRSGSEEGEIEED